MSDLFIKKTEQQKVDAWENIMSNRNKFYQDVYLYEQSEANKSALMKLIKLEFEGGECWICKTQWKKKEFNNKFLKGFYFIPVCECFVRCPFCKSELYDSQFKYHNKLYKCDNCGFSLYNKVTKSKRYGGEYEIYFNNLTQKEKIQAWLEK